MKSIRSFRCRVRPATASVALAVGLLMPGALRAQTDVEEIGKRYGVRPPPGYFETLVRHPKAFRFSQNNGWIRRGREIAARRGAMRGQLASGMPGVQQAHMNANGIMVGDVYMPVFLAVYQDRDSAALSSNVPRSSLETSLFGTGAAPPYSVHTFYLEVSNDSLRVNGTVFDWTRVDSAGSYYEGSSNGLGGDGAVDELIAELIAAYDGAIDFGQFDNDGADGIPNSPDDDGFVDAIVIMHPDVDGACGTSHIWAHRWTYDGWTGSPLSTNDPAAGGGVIQVNDYIIQGGQGGSSGCFPNQPQAPGLISHETGHLFGLPDLYNTNGARSSQGIGHWGLMGSGNWNDADSPAHLEAWSRAQLGWVTEIILPNDTAVTIEAVALSDTAYVIPIPSSNEYFLLENRQKLGSDVRLHERGLLIWHVDSVLARTRSALNTVNAVEPEAVRLMQADGLDALRLGVNRGDAGDPWPGSTGATRFSFDTDPSSAKNDGSPTAVTVDSVEQLDPLGPAGAIRVVITHSAALLVMDPADPPDGSMGSSYQYQFSASGGLGGYTWQVTAGELPEGITLGATTGMLTGVPAETGSFSATVEVASGIQTEDQVVAFDVSAPVLQPMAVLNELLEVEQTLTADELLYLDLLGNRNSGYDVGDFHAWVDSGDAPATAAALAERIAALRGRGR